MSRVKSRNRQEEMEIPAEFFYNIHHLHEDWLIRRNSSAGVVTPQVSDEIINILEIMSLAFKAY